MNGLCKICDTNHWEPQDHPFTPRAAAPPQVPSPSAISDQFIPGNYRCGQCGFVLVKSVMCTSDGNIYANTRQDYELCPNDGGPMRPITWKEGYEEGCKMQAELLKRLETASNVSREPQADDEIVTLLVELVEEYHLKGEPPDSHCRICQIYMRANPMKSRAEVSREPISAERWLRDHLWESEPFPMSLETFGRIVKILEAYAHSLTTHSEERL